MGAALRLGEAPRHTGAGRARGGAQPRTGCGGGGVGLKLLPRILPDEEEEERRLDQPESAPERAPKPQPLHWTWTAGVAAIAAVPRLLYLYVFTDPENPGLGAYNDVWHHWQIAYLTKEIGLSAPGGPRLWDLKGLDYFWGVLHPLLMVAVFDITGSIDIVLDRLVSVAFGVAVVVLLFHMPSLLGHASRPGRSADGDFSPDKRDERRLGDAGADGRGAPFDRCVGVAA